MSAPIEKDERVVAVMSDDPTSAQYPSGVVLARLADGLLRIRWDDDFESVSPESSVCREGEMLTLNQLTDFEAQALRLTVPPKISTPSSRQRAGDTRREYERQEALERKQRDRLAAIVSILLRDAVMLAGGDDVMGAFDRTEVRRVYVDTVATLVDSSELVLDDETEIAAVEHEDLLNRIGRALINAAAVKVIDTVRSWLG